MADILSDQELEQLIDKCIVHGDKSCVRPNTYDLRLGSKAEFKTTEERIELKEGEYIEIGPGQSVAVTSYEVIDFRQETVNEIFPGKALMGFINTRTTLMRENISQVATKIDAGFFGRLDWTFRNQHHKPIILAFKEKLFNLTVFRLSEEEGPVFEYGKRASEDTYQGSDGLQPSTRKLPTQIPSSLIKRASLKEVTTRKQLKEYGPPISWIGTELDTLEEKVESIANGMKQGFKDVLRDMESFVTKKFLGFYAFMTAVVAAAVGIIQLMKDTEKQNWIGGLLLGFGGICFIIVIIGLITGRSKGQK